MVAPLRCLRSAVSHDTDNHRFHIDPQLLAPHPVAPGRHAAARDGDLELLLATVSHHPEALALPDCGVPTDAVHRRTFSDLEQRPRQGLGVGLKYLRA